MGRTAGIEVIRWCGEEARAGPWRGRRDVAYLAPLAGGPTPSSGFVECCLDRLAASGFTQVVTSALTPCDQAAFLGAGFQVEERLRVLAHDLRHLRPAPPLHGIALRRGTANDWPELLDVDHLAFEPFWRLDEAGLDEAISATPHTRVRVALRQAPAIVSGGTDRGSGGVLGGAAGSAEVGRVVGYAVTGRALGRGFVQRLAVHPAHQGAGVGSALVLDGLRWLRRWRVESAFVNTQTANHRAFGLYQSLGFRADAGALSVLSAGIFR